MSEKLYIEIVDGVPANHPALESNIIAAFGEIPSRFVPFNRVHPLDSNVTVGVYQKHKRIYALSEDGVTWTDTWHAEDMTPEEISQKQQTVKDHWAKHPAGDNHSAWTFNEELCKFQPPIPRPSDPPPDGHRHWWHGKTNSWRLLADPPHHGYELNYETWEWQLPDHITTSTATVSTPIAT